MPHLHDSPDNSFGLAVSPWCLGFGKTLLYIVLNALDHKFMMSWITLIFPAIVSIINLDGIGNILLLPGLRNFDDECWVLSGNMAA